MSWLSGRGDVPCAACDLPEAAVSVSVTPD